MISKRTVQLIGLRTKLFRIFGGTAFGWDSTLQRMVPSNFYQFMTMISQAIIGGVIFCAICAAQMYMNLTFVDIPEENVDIPENSALDQLLNFGTMMFLCAEFILVTMFTLLQYEIARHRDTVIYLVNQLLDYDTKIGKMLADKKIPMDSAHEKVMRTCETFILLAVSFSTIVPIGIVIGMFHPIEPNHVMMQDWLELEFSLKLDMTHMILLMTTSTLNEGNVAAVLGIVVIIYGLTAVTCIVDMTPKKVDTEKEKGRSSSHFLVTKYYGTLDDMELVIMYRTQQIFNLLTKEIFDHVTFASHHVGLIVTFSVILCFTVKFNAVLSEEEILAYLLMFSMLLTPEVIIYIQTSECGKLVESSREFGDVCKRKLVMKPDRSTKAFRRFARTCTPLYIPVAYPFYNVDRGTFLEFFDQGLDKAITLMLW